MNLLLHVGPHKTGTTTVQKFLYKNRHELFKYKILYPDVGIYNSQHSLIPLSMFPARRSFKFLTKNERNLNYHLDLLKKDLDKHQPPLTIMSSEVWSRRGFHRDPRFFKLMSQVRPIFNKITILFSKRHPDHRALSCLKHHIRNYKGDDPRMVNHRYIEFYFDILQDTINIYNFWENYELPLITRNLEDARGNLVDYYFGDIIEEYSKEARLILKNNKEEIENKDCFLPYVYLGLFLYGKHSIEIDFFQKFILSNKEKLKQVNNQQLILFLKYFEKKYHEKTLNNISWKEKMSALESAQILT